jgi:translocation and assembly module TamB
MSIDAKKLWHMARIPLGAMGALLLVAVLTFVSPLGRHLVASALLDVLSGEGKASAEEVGGAWPGTLTLDHVVLADKTGPWLTIERATLVWRPLALLRGRLAITTLKVDAPVLLRQPISSGAASSRRKSESVLSLPIAVEADDIVIDKGRVQGSAGQSIGLNAKGAITLEDARKTADLTLVREGGADEHARVFVLIDSKNHGIAVDADVKGAQGGLFALLLGRPELPAFAVAAHGAGPATHWQFDGHAAGGGYGALALKGTLAWTDAIILDAAGSFIAGDALPKTLRMALGSSAAVIAHYERDKAGAMAGRLKLDAEAARLEAGAQVKAGGLFEGQPLDGTLSLRTIKPVALDGSSIAGTALDATLTGTLAHPHLALKLGVESANLDGYNLSGFRGEFSAVLAPGLAGRSFTLEGSGTLADAGVARGTVLENAAWQLKTKGNLNQASLDDAALTLASEALALDAKGSYGQSGAAALDATLTAKSLAPLSPLLDLDLQGAGTMHALLARAKSGATLSAKLQGRFEHAVIDGTDLAPLAGAALLLDATAEQDAAGPLTIKDLTLSGDHLSAKGAGRLRPDLNAIVTLDAGLGGLAVFAKIPADGKAHARIEAKGSLAHPRLAVVLDSPDAIVSGRTIGTLKLSLTPATDAPIPSGRVILFSRGPLGGSDLIVPLIRANGEWTIGPFAGTAFGGQISGSLRWSKGDLTGAVKAAFSNLSGPYSLARNVPKRMDGRAAVTLNLGAARDLSLSVTGRGLRAKEGRIAIDRLTIDGARNSDRVTLSATLTDMHLPGADAPIDVKRLTVNAQGPETALAWRLAADAPTGPAGKLDASGVLRRQDDTTVVSLDSLSGNLWREPVALEAPSALTLSAAGPALNPLALKIGGGRLALSYQESGKTRKADLAASAVPVVFLGRILSADWPQGRFEGHAGLDIARGRASGFLDFSLANAVFTRVAAGTVQPIEGHLKGSWNGNSLVLDVRSSGATGPGTEPLLLTAKLPLVYHPASGAITMDQAGPVSGQIHWVGRLGALWALLPYDLHRLDGDAQVDGTAAGRFGAPKLAGTLAVRGGVYESIATGTRLRNLTLDAKASGGAIALSVSGEDGQGGTLSGSGDLQPGEKGALSAAVEFKKLRLVGLDAVTAEASGPVRLTGTAAHPRLEGTLQLDHMDAAIPDQLPPSIPLLPVKEVGDIASTLPLPETDEAPEARAQALDLALELDIPGQAFLHGRGLTSEWRGHLSARGTSAAPLVTGSIEIVKGDIAFAGRSYALTRGKAVFDGGPKVDPTLDAATERMVSGTLVALTVSGRASAPVLELTSTPPLPQDQAMALFLFGKPAQSLTTLELLDVARSIATLSGTGRGFDPLDKLRRGLGLDILTVDVDGDAGTTGGTSSIASGTTLSAGRYISRKVYLGVKQGATTTSSAVQLDYALTPHLSVGTEVGVTSGESATVDYKWDY